MDGFAGRRFQPCLPLGAAHSSLGASGPCVARQRDMSVYVGLSRERRCPVFLPTFLRRTCLVAAPRPAVWVQPEAPQAPVPRRSADTRLARTCRGIHTAMGSSRREGTGSTTEGHHAGLGRRTWRGEREGAQGHRPRTRLSWTDPGRRTEILQPPGKEQTGMESE